MKSIGIDIGTTTVSIVAVDLETNTVVDSRTIKNDSFIPSARAWERVQDVGKILFCAVTALEDFLQKYSDIAAIGLSGQMHGIVYTDDRGRAVSPLYTWQDKRAEDEDFDGRSICAVLEEDCGIHAAPGYGMATHLYFVKKGLVPEGAVSFCTIADYVGMALTGRSRPLVHISQAASLGLYDHEAKAFRMDVLAKMGADLSLIPQVTDELSVLGTYRGAGAESRITAGSGAGTEIPVFVSIGDNQASFLGAVRDPENSVLVNVGTGSQISVQSDHYYDGKGIEARPLSKDSYLLVGSAICGGASFAYLEKFFRTYAAAAGAPDVPQYDVMKKLLEEHAEASAEQAAKYAADDFWKVRTTFAGTREDPDETGSMTGITTANFHPAALIGGVLDGMAEELYDMYRIMEEEAGISRSVLVGSGNGIRMNRALQDILSRKFEMPLEVEKNEEEAAFGAAVNAAISQSGR